MCLIDVFDWALENFLVAPMTPSLLTVGRRRSTMRSEAVCHVRLKSHQSMVREIDVVIALQLNLPEKVT